MSDVSKILEINVASMAQNKPYLINMMDRLKEEEYRYQGIITDVFTAQSMAGERIIGVVSDGRDWYLNSRYHDEKAIEIWVQACREKDYYGVIVLVGMANLAYVRKFREIYPEVMLLVYEPDQYIWNKNISEVDMTDIIEDPKTYIIVGKIGKNLLEDLLAQTIEYANYKYVQLLISPNYEVVYECECLEARKALYKRIEDVIIDRNTQYRFGRIAQKNRCINLCDSFDQYNAEELKRVLCELDLTKVPAIVVAAGPSLEKNIKELKQAVGKAFIIATDSAIKVLMKESILPDLTVTVDPAKMISHLYTDDVIQKIPVLLNLASNSELLEYHKGKRFYYYHPYTLGEKIWADNDIRYMVIETGGSVANDALSFAIRVGFSKVILIGQDLAYPERKIHAESAYGEKLNNSTDSIEIPLFEVPDVYGQPILTDAVMSSYRLWIERQIEIHKETEIIDATEGGAKIKGTTIMSLSEALSYACLSDQYLNFSGLISKTEPAYTEEKRKKAYEYLINVYNDMDQVKKKLINTKNTYEKLAWLNKRHDYTSKEFKKTISAITKYNNWVEKDPQVNFLAEYSGKESYHAMENLYEGDSEQEQISAVVNSGLGLVEAYTESVQLFREDMEPLIDKMKKDI